MQVANSERTKHPYYLRLSLAQCEDGCILARNGREADTAGIRPGWERIHWVRACVRAVVGTDTYLFTAEVHRDRVAARQLMYVVRSHKILHREWSGADA
ncbi:MAG: hypothetical protein JSU86_11105 [Phycisphaerales bacterium]|nr:MAG: hypothetical protein JSU86_11105 [Phycisphaerales bacterium]